MRFSIRDILVLMTVLCVVLGIIATHSDIRKRTRTVPSGSVAIAVPIDADSESAPVIYPEGDFILPRGYKYGTLPAEQGVSELVFRAPPGADTFHHAHNEIIGQSEGEKYLSVRVHYAIPAKKLHELGRQRVIDVEQFEITVLGPLVTRALPTPENFNPDDIDAVFALTKSLTADLDRSSQMCGIDIQSARISMFGLTGSGAAETKGE